jgi:hypothetical protein
MKRNAEIGLFTKPSKGWFNPAFLLTKPKEVAKNPDSVERE